MQNFLEIAAANPAPAAFATFMCLGTIFGFFNTLLTNQELDLLDTGVEKLKTSFDELAEDISSLKSKKEPQKTLDDLIKEEEAKNGPWITKG